MAPRKSTKSPVPAVEAPEVEAPKSVKGKAKPASEPAKAAPKSPARKPKALSAPAVAPETTPAPEAPVKARSRKPAAPRSAAVAAALAEELATAEVPPRAPRPKAAPKTEVAPEPVKVDTKPARKAKAEAEAPSAPAPKAQAKPERRDRSRKPGPITEVDAPRITLPAENLPPMVSTAIAAVRAGKAIELIFADQDNNPPRTFEARQVLFDVFTGQWFLWGWDRRYNAERHHRVDLLAEVNVVEGVGRSAQGPYAEGTPANQIGGWRGGEVIPVKATLQKQWVFAVRQAPAPFPDFVLSEQEDGRALVSFTATDLRAIARWIMQFGDGVTVQEPLRLVDRIKQVAQAWGAKLPVAAAPKGAPAQAAPRPVPAAAPRAEARPEARAEGRPEARAEGRPEARAEGRPTRVREHKETREQRESRDAETKSRTSRVEIRIDRL